MKRLRNCLLLSVISLLSLIAFGADASAADPGSPIRVLILTGRNNHNWKETTPILRQVLEASGKFHVDTTAAPQGLTRENLNNYDVILSNWNSWGDDAKEAEAAWTAPMRQAYLDFVRGGKGHVTVHAGGCSFYEGWPEYRNVALVYWNLGVTRHGHEHQFEVRIDKPDHPIGAALKGFTIRDELWRKPGVVPQATVVASAEGQPSVVTAKYGKGHCFATLLGHDTYNMENKGFKQLLVCGVEWAATGKLVSDVAPDAE